MAALSFEAGGARSSGMTEPVRTLDTLYGVHRDELLRFLLARTGTREDAEDLLQDLWIRARQQAGAPVANGRAYLYRMAQNLVIDRLRERQRRGRRERSWQDGRTTGGCDAAEPVDPARPADEQLIEREEVALLASALATLPDGAGRVFELHKLKGLSHAQVAAALGISKSGVEKHMAVAMKYLRRALAD